MTSPSSERILIVDDTPSNLSVISDVLSEAGFNVAIATSGERALKQLQLALPELVLLDVMMPGMDGFEVCRCLKSQVETQDVPIIFMTALSDATSKVKGFELGAVDYITKPFQATEVLARVRTHIQLRCLSKVLELQVEQRTHELQQAMKQLKASQLHLVNSEKMAALGNLVSGIAHEINNPIGFIQGNIEHISTYTKDLLQLVNLYQQHYPHPPEEIEEITEEMDLNFLQKDLPELIASLKAGADRIRHISTSLRTFSRTDTEDRVAFDLQDGIDSTLLILKHRTKPTETRPEIEVVKAYQALPEADCFPGQLNQVFMNLIANSIDALEESNEGRSFQEIAAAPNQIVIRTEATAEKISIHISDNGRGMPEAVKARIFEQGFTTKKVGKGTGLGLAIAHQIIQEKHGGVLSCTSEIGKGTTFTIELPIVSSASPCVQPPLLTQSSPV